ncbi:GGDEF domain-containing protein [Hydrogenimonas sp.]
MADKREKIARTALFLEGKKGDIARAWVSKKSVAQILFKYHIDPDAFGSDIALKIIDYFVKVLRQQEPVGRCPIMNRFIDLMYEKKITVKEVFLICMGLRRALFSQMISHGEVSRKDPWIIEVLSELFDQNLSGVLEYFDELILRERLEKQHRESVEKYTHRISTILDLQENAIFKIRNGELFLANSAFYKTVGASGRDDFMLNHPDIWSFIERVDCFGSLFVAGKYEEWLRTTLRKRDGRCEVELFDYRSNRKAQMEMTIRPMPKGEEGEYVIAMHDITEQKARLASMAQMVYTDALTQVPNRRKFNETIRKYLKRCKDENRPFYLLLIDIDNLTEINETLGRDGGDLILKTFAKGMLDHLDEKSFFARIDGERFVLLAEEADSDRAEALANKVLAELHTIFYSEEEHTKGNVAIVSCQPNDDIGTMLSRGDRIVQRIIDRGGDGVMDDTLLVEEDRQIKTAAERFLAECRLLFEKREPLEVVNYYLEVPIDSKAKIVRIIGDLVWVKLRRVAVHTLHRECEIYIKTEEKPYFKAVVEDLDREKQWVRLGHFEPVIHSPLDRKHYHVRLVPSVEGILHKGRMQIPVDLESISVDSLTISMTHMTDLVLDDRVEIETTLRWSDRTENVTLPGQIYKMKKSGSNIRTVIMLEPSKTAEDILTQFVAYRQLEIIKELKESML